MKKKAIRFYSKEGVYCGCRMANARHFGEIQSWIYSGNSIRVGGEEIKGRRSLKNSAEQAWKVLTIGKGGGRIMKTTLIMDYVESDISGCYFCDPQRKVVLCYPELREYFPGVGRETLFITLRDKSFPHATELIPIGIPRRGIVEAIFAKPEERFLFQLMKAFNCNSLFINLTQSGQPIPGPRSIIFA